MVANKSNHVAVWMEFLKNGLQTGDPTVIGILVAVAVVFLTILFFSIKQRGHNRRGVLILGSCDAGKTLLFSQLVHKKFKQTFTSMSANSGMYTVPEKNTQLRLIDLPGHDRIRTQILDGYKDSARAVVFVVDSSSVQKDIKDIGEYLYTVLSDSKISTNAPPVLIACNKQDLTFSKGVKVIQNQLEKEMNTVRVTKSAALQDTSARNNNTYLGKRLFEMQYVISCILNTVRVTKSAALQDTSAGNNNTYLGKRNKDFTFSDLKPIKVDFVECSAQGKSPGDEPNLSEIEQWLTKVA